MMSEQKNNATNKTPRMLFREVLWIKLPCTRLFPILPYQATAYPKQLVVANAHSSIVHTILVLAMKLLCQKRAVSSIGVCHQSL